MNFLLNILRLSNTTEYSHKLLFRFYVSFYSTSRKFNTIFLRFNNRIIECYRNNTNTNVRNSSRARVNIGV